MSEKAFTKLMRGLEEAKAYMEGEREGYKVTVPPASGLSNRGTGKTKSLEGEQAQMKTAWDSYLDQQLADPILRKAFEKETKVLNSRLSPRKGKAIL